MSERVFVEQNFTPVELSQLLTKVKDLKAIDLARLAPQS